MVVAADVLAADVAALGSAVCARAGHRGAALSSAARLPALERGDVTVSAAVRQLLPPLHAAQGPLPLRRNILSLRGRKEN